MYFRYINNKKTR